MLETCRTGDAAGVGDGPMLGDGLGPGPGSAEYPPPPPQPATTAAPSAAATHAPMANCLLLMIAFDSFESYLPQYFERSRRRSWKEIAQPHHQQVERVRSVPVQPVLRLGHEDDVAFLKRHVDGRVPVLQRIVEIDVEVLHLPGGGRAR